MNEGEWKEDVELQALVSISPWIEDSLGTSFPFPTLISFAVYQCPGSKEGLLPPSIQQRNTRSTEEMQRPILIQACRWGDASLSQNHQLGSLARAYCLIWFSSIHSSVITRFQLPLKKTCKHRWERKKKKAGRKISCHLSEAFRQEPGWCSKNKQIHYACRGCLLGPWNKKMEPAGV